jgi:hypothetical protein
MGLKRRPPDGNVRRVVSIGGNLRRSTFLIYLQYADLLGYSLSDLIAMDSP